ncbi:MAG: hypothetical protein K6E56_02845, partial [Lachnospiraceae bacterium]|nr:hypothetical protein [Lachnospiraceae bacterium]
PTSVPELSVGTAMSAEDFVKKITQTFGEDCLSDVKFIKESGGEAAAEGGLQQSDAALWDDLNKSFTDQAINKKALQSGLDKAGTIKVRYLALQKALGALEQLAAPDNAEAGNNDEDVDIE